jgi:predicted MFS family arabinose efflux permease
MRCGAVIDGTKGCGEWAGYRAGFVTLAAIAAIAPLVFWFAMPETKVSMQPARSAA